MIKNLILDFDGLLQEGCAPGHKLAPEVIDTLLILYENGLKLAIASRRSRQTLKEFADKMSLSPLIAVMAASDDGVGAPPLPANLPMQSILQKMGWNPQETMMVAHTPSDIDMALQAGLSICAVIKGFSPQDYLAAANPQWVLDRFDQLPPVLGMAE